MREPQLSLFGNVKYKAPNFKTGRDERDSQAKSQLQTV